MQGFTVPNLTSRNNNIYRLFMEVKILVRVKGRNL